MKLDEPTAEQKLSVRSRRKISKPDDAMLLLNFGTDREGFTGSQIAQAAIADIRRLERNRRRSADKKDRKAQRLPTKDIGPMEKYAFLARHVTKSITPHGLLKLALEDRLRGENSTVASTVRLYRSVDGLKAALLIAQNESPIIEAPESEPPLPLGREV